MKSYFMIVQFIFVPLFIFSCAKNNPIESNVSEVKFEVCISYDEIFKDTEQGGPDRVEDFDLNSKKLYIHPTSSFGLYQYDFTSKELKLLTIYSSGNYIAHDSIYVFYEISGYNIFRYNLLKDTTDLQLDLVGLSYTNIYGMDVYHHILFVKLYSQNATNSVLAKFDLEGNFIASIPYARRSFFMAIHSEIEYSIFFSNGDEARLSRFDLSTNSFLETRLLPTENSDGIRIYENKFYFTDLKRRMIGIMPISELNN